MKKFLDQVFSTNFNDTAKRRINIDQYLSGSPDIRAVKISKEDFENILAFNDCYRNVSAEALLLIDEPLIEINDESEHNYTECNKIISSLNLTDNMRIALECRMAGLSYPEIGKILARAQSTVFEYFVKLRQRYAAIYE